LGFCWFFPVNLLLLPKIEEKETNERNPILNFFFFFFILKSHGACSRRCFVAHRKLPPAAVCLVCVCAAVPEIYGFSLLDNWCEKFPLKKDNSKKREWNTNNKKQNNKKLYFRYISEGPEETRERRVVIILTSRIPSVHVCCAPKI
jgi:hypothetical protein